MNVDPVVEITTEPGLNRQFGRHWRSYQNSPYGISNSLAMASGVALVVTVSVIVFTGNPKKSQSDQTSKFLGIEVPRGQSQAEMLIIPRFDPMTFPSPTAKANAGPRSAVRLFGPQVVSRPRNVQIPPGSMVEAILISGASDGPVKAELKGPLIVGGETLLEVGTVLMGTGQSGDDRLMIHFRKAIFRDGTMAKIEAQAADHSDKIPGIRGSHVGYRALKLAAGVGLSFAGGLSQGLQDTQGQAGAVVAPPSMKNALLNGAAHATLEEGQEMMNDYRNEKPVITVEAGTLVTVLFVDNG
ncbi:TrbI/VirB10 family protein [Bdellovibrionota bacterium FG-1]